MSVNDPLAFSIAFLYPDEYQRRTLTDKQQEEIINLTRRLSMLPPDKFLSLKGGTA